MLRNDEKAIADELIRALKEGWIEPLGAHPRADYVEGDDPPDLMVHLDTGSSVGVELGRVLGGDYPKQMKMAQQGELRCGVWSPKPSEHIERVFKKKAKNYDARGIKVGWLLFHDSLKDVRGFHNMGPDGHRELREKFEGIFSTGPFEKVLLQSEWRHQRYWSVLWARDNRMIPTPHAYVERLWKERLKDDERILAENIRVDHLGNYIFPAGGIGVVVLFDQAGELHDVRMAKGTPVRAAHWLTREGGFRHWGWFPTRAEADEVRVAADLYDRYLKDKPSWWHEARKDEKPEK